MDITQIEMGEMIALNTNVSKYIYYLFTIKKKGKINNKNPLIDLYSVGYK